MSNISDTIYITHYIITPTCEYTTRIYLSDGYHEHNFNGNWIDGHTSEMLHYEEVMHGYMRQTNMYSNDRYFTNMTIHIDEDDNVTIEFHKSDKEDTSDE